MQAAFIVTFGDDLPRVEACLAALAAVAGPGDQVVLVDNGSTDGTAERLGAGAGFSADVAVQSLYLGVPSGPGRAVAANAGLAAALARAAPSDAICLLQATERADPQGLADARRLIASDEADLVIGNLADPSLGPGPADLRPGPLGRDPGRRDAILGLTAWPGRFIARAGLWRAGGPGGDGSDGGPGDDGSLGRDGGRGDAGPWRDAGPGGAGAWRDGGLRLTEGPALDEDAPLYWALCLAARRIALRAGPLCHPAPGGGVAPDLTPDLTGALFDHHALLGALIGARAPAAPPRSRLMAALRAPPALSADDGLAVVALAWLLGRIGRQVRQLSAAAPSLWAERGARELAGVPERVWQALPPGLRGGPAGGLVGALRRGDVTGSLILMRHEAMAAELAALREAVAGLAPVLAQVTALAEIARFQALAEIAAPATTPDTP